MKTEMIRVPPCRSAAEGSSWDGPGRDEDVSPVMKGAVRLPAKNPRMSRVVDPMIRERCGVPEFPTDHVPTPPWGRISSPPPRLHRLTEIRRRRLLRGRLFTGAGGLDVGKGHHSSRTSDPLTATNGQGGCSVQVPLLM